MYKQFTSLIIACLFLGFGCSSPNQRMVLNESESLQNQLKMNEIQFLASHNSFRKHTYQPLYEFVIAISQQLNLGVDPTAWDYDHLPLPDQLSNYHLRGIELDIYNDPQGGHFANREGLKFVSEPTASGIPELEQPGMKVLHIPDLDYETNYYTFVTALQAVKAWSDLHPNHLPIVINVEAKTETIVDTQPLDNFAKGIPFDESAWQALDNEVKTVFGENLDKVITPDKIRGNYSTLKEAIQQKGWWTLAEARGKVIFVLDIAGSKLTQYLTGHPSFKNRVMFAYFSDDSNEGSAFIIKNDSEKYQAEIKSYVEKGYIVRTRADADTKEARTGNYYPLNAALASGAQIISTDYYRPDPRGTTDSGWTNYNAFIPGNVVARTNPTLNTSYKGRISE